MVAGFLDAIAKVRQFRFHNDDDSYDRLSRRYSVVLLMLFTVVVSTKQYVGDPIACFAPAQFTGKFYLKSMFCFKKQILCVSQVLMLNMPIIFVGYRIHIMSHLRVHYPLDMMNDLNISVCNEKYFFSFT